MGAPGSAHERATPSLFDPEVLLAAVVDTSDDAIFTCDIAGMVASWSATAERLFGSPAGDVIGCPFDEQFPEHLRSEVRIVLATALAGDRIRHFETEVFRPDGMPMPISVSLCPVFGRGREPPIAPQGGETVIARCGGEPPIATCGGDQPLARCGGAQTVGNNGGPPVGVVVIARDVTEQRLDQATLAELDARLDAGEALGHVGSWLWDLRTGTVQWSAELHRIHGVEPVNFDGTFESHLGLVHPADRDHVRAALERSITSGRAYEGEYRVLRPDQQVRVLHVLARPTIGSTGMAVGLRGIGQDVTERVQGGHQS
jgi:PAS domain S-box-containing protein